MLAPILALSLVTGYDAWLKAAVVTISTFIAFERGRLTPLGVFLHAIAILAGFLLMISALRVPLLFVLAASLMAAGAVWMTTYGRKLRSVGNFTFIPALYIACETAENTSPGMFMARAVELLPYLAVGALPVLILAIVHELIPDTEAAQRARNLFRLRRDGADEERIAAGEAVIAVILAVAAAATLVEWRHLDHGQWVVWSAASVVTGDAATAHLKLRDRAIGAFLGVPAGIGLGFFLPHGPLSYGLAVVASLMTLVAFHSYRLGFGTRCAAIAVALVIADQSTVIAAERVVNVLIGGIIGVAFVFAVHAMVRMSRPV
ncbi:FUSC family protein [Phyllobacterium salinisoli]|uniref:FUSC family protein n=1 Tax=Phyllobacterium salinisoli TaxID=1899321 RepID=A0A368KBE7_9HYPH|nr:FUSC family protein [Phyllobacterium salinisoli]